MARNDPQLNLRIPADLKGMLEAAASASGRSLTVEAVTRLRLSFSQPADSLQTSSALAPVLGEAMRIALIDLMHSGKLEVSMNPVKLEESDADSRGAGPKKPASRTPAKRSPKKE